MTAPKRNIMLRNSLKQFRPNPPTGSTVEAKQTETPPYKGCYGVSLPDGRTILVEEVRGTYGRETRAYRCRPGDFIWKYRKGHYGEEQYQAGVWLMALWETIGAGGIRGLDLASAGGGGSYAGGGLSASTCDAITFLMGATETIGKRAAERLYDHLVTDLTVKQLAAKWGRPEKKMAATLESDLLDLADYHSKATAR